MAGNDTSEWYAIENGFWCPCQDKLLLFQSEHLPDCVELKHKIIFKVYENVEFTANSDDVLPTIEPQRGAGKGRNSVVEEFLANLETLNTSRRRSSSKLLQGFVLDEEMTPSVATRSPGLDVYFPACFSASNLEKLVDSLDHEEFQFTGCGNISQNSPPMAPTIDNPRQNSKNFEVSQYETMSLQGNVVDSKFGSSRLKETTEKLGNISLHGSIDCKKQAEISNSAQRSSSREKLRRSTLNDRFANLCDAVLHDSDSCEKKLSKIGILRKAVECIKQLEHEEKMFCCLKDEEKTRNKELLRKLVELNEKQQ